MRGRRRSREYASSRAAVTMRWAGDSVGRRACKSRKKQPRVCVRVRVVRSLARRGPSRSRSQSRSERALDATLGGDQTSGSSLVTDLIERGVVELQARARWDNNQMEQ